MHVELAAGVVTILPAWKLDPVYCTDIKVGAPQVSISALGCLHELLVARESRLLCANVNTLAQENQDGTARTTRTETTARSENRASLASCTTATRPRAPRRKIGGHDDGRAPSCDPRSGASPTGSERHNDVGGRR